jgi:hypothetical protein
MNRIGFIGVGKAKPDEDPRNFDLSGGMEDGGTKPCFFCIELKRINVKSFMDLMNRRKAPPLKPRMGDLPGRAVINGVGD